MPEVAIRLYGQGPSFDAKAGPLTGLVEVEGGTSGYLLDVERGRCRVAAFPGPERDKWTSAVGVLLAARRGLWGLAIRLDLVVSPPGIDLDAPVVEVEAGRRAWKRPRLPRDLASCPACGLLVVVERARGGGPGFRLATPTRRLARRAEQVMLAAGFFSFVSTFVGRGEKAGREHAADCLAFPSFRPFADPGPRRRPGRPRVEKPPKVPLPYAINRDYSRTKGGKPR